MAVDFGILERTPTIGSRFMEGQQAAQQQAERNMLRQMQMQQMAIQQENMLAQRENMAAQREERAAHAEERRAKIAQARAAEARLAQFGTAWKQLTGRDELTEDDVRQIEGEAFASRDPNAMTLAKGLRADFNTRAESRRVAALFGPQEMPTGAPTVAPAAPAEAPANALAAPAAMPTAAPALPTAPAAAAAPPALGARRETVRIGGRDFTEQDLLQLSADPNPRVQAAAKAALDLMKANKPPTDQAMMTSLGIPLTPEGFAQYKLLGQQPAADIQAYDRAVQQGFKGDIFEFKRQLAMAGRAPAQPPQPQPPVAVVDPTTGKTVYVSREEALRGRMTPAASIEGLSPKEIQRREAVLPQAKQAVRTVVSTMTTLEETIDRLLKNKTGLNQITGVIGEFGQRIAPLTDAARDAQADLNQIKNLAFVKGITDLRAASKTGAAVGSVSDREGVRFENLEASTDQKQSYDSIVKAMIRLKTLAVGTRESMQQAFDDTYAYKSEAPAAAPTPAAAPATATGASRRREIAPGVFVTERP